MVDVSDQHLFDPGFAQLHLHMVARLTSPPTVFSDNRAGVEGCEALAEALKINKALSRLDVSGANSTSHLLTVFDKMARMSVPRRGFALPRRTGLKFKQLVDPSESEGF
eukprot:6184306-Pleurochrysis_carterae.AAC.3